jgi:hypothetical protein
VPEVFLLTGIANAMFSAYVFVRVPAYWQAFVGLVRVRA